MVNFLHFFNIKKIVSQNRYRFNLSFELICVYLAIILVIYSTCTPKFIKKIPSNVAEIKSELVDKYRNNQANLEEISKLAFIYKLEGNYKKSYKLFKLALNSLNKTNQFLAEIYLYLIDYLAEDTDFTEDYIKFIKEYTKKIDNKYYIKDIALFLLMNTYYREGDIKKAQNIAKHLGFITDWYIIGPFKNENRSGMETLFMPEVEINFNKIYTDGAFHPVKWRKIFKPPFSKIDIKNYFTPDKNCVAYFLTFIDVPEDKYYYIGIGTDDGYKLWINDTLIKENNIYRKAFFDQERFKVYLKKGINKILLKISQEYFDWELYFRIFPVDYQIISFRKRNVLAKYKKQIMSRADYKIHTIEEKTFPDYLNKIPFDKEFLAGYYYFITKNYPDTIKLDSEYFGRAIEKEKQNPLFYYYCALTGFTKEEYKKYLITSINFYEQNYEAKLRLGIYYLNNNYFNSALNLFNEVIEGNPRFYNAYFYRGKLFYRKRLFQEALSDFQKCINANYNLWNSLYYIGNIYWERKEQEKAGKALLRAFELKPLYFNVCKTPRIFKYLNYADQREKIPQIYFKRLALVGASPFLYNKLAQFYFYNEEINKAATIISDSLQTDPYNVETLKIASDIKLKEGKRNEAVKYLSRILKVTPHQKNIKRRLLFLKSEKETIIEKYAPNTDKIIKRLFSKGLLWYRNRFPNSSGIIFYQNKIIKISQDGTKETLVTFIYYILNSAGIETFKCEKIDYNPNKEEVEIISAKTISRDGKQIESNDIKEHSLIDIEKNLYYSYYTKIVSFSDVKVDSAIVFQYRIWSKSYNQMEKSYFGDIEVFADFCPSLKKEFILIVPSKIKLYYKYKNFSKRPKLKKHRKYGYTIYQWKQKNLFKLNFEPDMGSPFSIVPQIQISTFRKWDEVAKWLSNLSEPQIGLNLQMRALVNEIRNNSKSKEEIIEKLYNYVRDNIRYVGLEYGIGGIKPRNAVSVFFSKFGDCKDKAILLISFLRCIGIDSYLALVRTSDKGETNFELPLIDMFDHAICVAYSGNKTYFLDPTALYYNFNELPYYDRANKIFLIKDTGKFISPPKLSWKENLFEVYSEGIIDDSGNLKLKRKITVKGQVAPTLRYFAIDTSYHKRHIENIWNSEYPGTYLYSIKEKNTDSSCPGFEYDILVKNFTLISKKSFKFKPILNKSDLFEKFFKLNKRNYPLILSFPYISKEKIVYSFENDKIKDIKLPKNVNIKSKWIDLKIKYKKSKRKIIVDYVLKIKKYKISPIEYNSLRQIVLAIKKAEEVQIKVIQK